MKYFLILYYLCIQLTCYSQKPDLSSDPLDTINNIVYGSYPEIFRTSFNGIPDSIIAEFPNRNQVYFESISSSQRDSLVAVYWKKLRDEFNSSIDFDSINISKRTKKFFFTLHFTPEGTVKYIFYNWDQHPDNNKPFNDAFIKFTSEYNFTGFPRGLRWSQCGTFLYKNGKPKTMK